jgi:hypothetical protein
MADPSKVYWQWRARFKPGVSGPWFTAEKWTLLRWRMTEAGAAEWAGNNDCEIEKIEGSGEERDGSVRAAMSAAQTSAPGQEQ